MKFAQNQTPPASKPGKIIAKRISKPSSPPSRAGSKRKSIPKEKYNKELPAGIGDSSSVSPLVVGGYLNMGDMSGGNGYIRGPPQ